MYLICTVPLGTLKGAFKIKCIIFIVIVMFDVHVVCSFRYEYNTCMGMGGLQWTSSSCYPVDNSLALAEKTWCGSVVCVMEWPVEICCRLLLHGAHMAIPVSISGGWPCLRWMSGDLGCQSPTWAFVCIEMYCTTWCV